MVLVSFCGVYVLSIVAPKLLNSELRRDAHSRFSGVDRARSGMNYRYKKTYDSRSFSDKIRAQFPSFSEGRDLQGPLGISSYYSGIPGLQLPSFQPIGVTCPPCFWQQP